MEEEDKEGTFPDLKRRLPKDIEELAESKATKELRNLISSLELHLTRPPVEAFLTNKYPKGQITTVFPHTEAAYQEARVKILRQKVNQRMQEQLKGFSFA